jgi:hypothetical protein
MLKENEQIILQEYEYLLGARSALARGDHASYESFLADIRKDVSGEYDANLDDKIERWIDVTRAQFWRRSQPVEFYIQAKMLYRDAFFEATIMMARSVCEMVCYEFLETAPHPFGSREDVEKENFRKLARFLKEDAKVLPDRSFDLMNEIYDIGNNYVHPKANQNSKDDSKTCLLKLGKALWSIYGAAGTELRPGVTIQSAYTSFPDICSRYAFPIDVFVTPEAAEKEALRWGHKNSANKSFHRIANKSGSRFGVKSLFLTLS